MSELAAWYKELKRYRRQLTTARAESNLDDLIEQSKKHDFGFRFINKEQGHLRVDSNIEFWLSRGKWWHAHSGTKGQGVASMVKFLLDWNGRRED